MAAKHPELRDMTCRCTSCGSEYPLKSASGKPHNALDACPACHPAYTGQHRAVAATGRVQAFMDRFQSK